MTGTGAVASPLKWHGGKSYLAVKLVALMPDHLHFIEPYAGGLSVLLAKDPEGKSEVVNDLSGDLTNFWRVLQHPNLFEKFHRACQATPFSEAEYEYAGNCGSKLPWDLARAFFVRCRQSLAGRMQSFAPLSRNRVRRGMNEQASAWLSVVEGLPEVHARLKRVVVLNRDALHVIRQQDGEKTLFYCDPPYLHETRATTSEYEYEMTTDQHVELLASLNRVRGKVMLSGYRSAVYDTHLVHWTRHDFDLPNNAAGGKSKRRMTECVWCNF